MKPVYTDIGEEYRALRETTGLLDYEGAGLFRVFGPEAAAFLGRVSTRNVDFLLEGQISSALALREDGTIVAELTIHCVGRDYLIEVSPTQRDEVAAHLAAAAAAFDGVGIEDVSDEYGVFGIEGPKSFRVAQSLLPFPVASMAYRSFTLVPWGDTGAELLISRTGVTGEYGYKMHVPTAHAAAVRDELVVLGARECGSDALDICRMEMRFANVDREGGDTPFTPFDLGIQWMVDFQHEFTGRAALLARWEGLDRLPVCWVADAAENSVPVGGASVTAGGSDVGRVVHALRSPKLDRVIGTARVDRAVAASGVRLGVGTGAITTISAPFLVATSFGTSLD